MKSGGRVGRQAQVMAVPVSTMVQMVGLVELPGGKGKVIPGLGEGMGKRMVDQVNRGSGSGSASVPVMSFEESLV